MMKIKVNEIVIDKNGREWANLPWIKEGVCQPMLRRDSKVACQLGYACDACPYTPEGVKIRD